ncbi:ATP-binding protein [Spongiactinospora rosea]|uniref:ATP-binding protein n=1 Tax=Spongiactinospora rosea TaxID=2248750 RepID=A0A366M3Y3_9ACTN|nr:ATP-binding protein [Spongiactinospora rosea]RBQ20757.1 ATP-binding protein [Spongiactinospora rosea]
MSDLEQYSHPDSQFLGKVLLPGVVTSVPVARAFARALLAVHGHAGDEFPVLLVVSELIGNSVQHSDSGRVPDGRVWVAFELVGPVLHVTVGDGGAVASVPKMCDAGGDGEGGRGLALVDEYATKWGVDEIATGRSVWADLELKWPA